MSRVDLFATRPVLIGMVHLLPLPGAPRYGGDLTAVADRARFDAAALADAGFSAVMVENYGDSPFLPGPVGPETVAAMARISLCVAAECGLPIGINVLRNDARAALGIAAVVDARFIRVNVHCGSTVTDQGILTGRAHETIRERARLGADVLVLADVLVKHGRPLGVDDPALAARDAVHRGHADALIVTGAATGATADPDRVREVLAAVPGTPVLVGSGLTEATANTFFPLAAGAIVGTSIKVDGVSDAPVDLGRARHLVEAVREAAAR